MNKTKLNWTVSNIERMYREKKTLSFEHPIQRKSEQWDSGQKSLLIHSMLANYPIPNIYVLREDSDEVDEKNKPVFNYYVMDGKQRLTSVLAYIWGEFPLDESIPVVSIDESQYEVGGKYFCELDEPVKYEIQRFKFEIVAFEACTDCEVEEIFYRLNNSTPLTKAQVAKAKVGVDLANMINLLLETKFFTLSCNFSKAQLKQADDQRSLIQGMMLLDTKHAGYALEDFSENNIIKYSEGIHDNYTDKQSDCLRNAVQYLGDAFPEKDRNLRKISIPMVIYLSDVAIDYGIKTRQFREWWGSFTSDSEMYELYKTFCSSGSTKLEKIKGRLIIMTMSFCNFFEKPVPEELKGMLGEVESRIATSDEEDKETAEGVEDVQQDEIIQETIPCDEQRMEEGASMNEAAVAEAIQYVDTDI